MTISIVVLTYNRKDSVVELLDHLSALKPHVAEIIVIDNASEDGTGAAIRSEYDWADYRANAENLGAVGRSEGMLAARGDIVITLDDDIFGLTPEDLVHITESFATDDSLGVQNFRVVDYYSDKLCNWVHHCPPSRADESFETYEITEGAAAFRATALRQVGAYWPDFFIGHEGPDLAFRLMDAGYAVRYDGSVSVRHKHESTGRLGWRFYYYDTRNTIWLVARRMSGWMALRSLIVGLGSMAVYSLRDGFTRHWFRAVWDGVRALPQVMKTRSPMTPRTRAIVDRIDKERPGFLSMVRQRLFAPANRLDG